MLLGLTTILVTASPARGLLPSGFTRRTQSLPEFVVSYTPLPPRASSPFVSLPEPTYRRRGLLLATFLAMPMAMAPAVVTCGGWAGRPSVAGLMVAGQLTLPSRSGCQLKPPSMVFQAPPSVVM